MTSSYRSVNSPMFCGVTKPKEGYCSGPSAAVPRLTWISESRFTTHAVVDAVGKVARDFHGKYRANLRLSFRAAKNLSCRATIGPTWKISDPRSWMLDRFLFGIQDPGSMLVISCGGVAWLVRSASAFPT